MSDVTLKDMIDGQFGVMIAEKKNNNHYYRDVSKYSQIDVYRVLKLFNVTDQNIGHAIKKLLAPGVRSGGKSYEQDIIDARDSLNRALEMIEEDK